MWVLLALWGHRVRMGYPEHLGQRALKEMQATWDPLARRDPRETPDLQETQGVLGTQDPRDTPGAPEGLDPLVSLGLPDQLALPAQQA
jgi:hypothetical protein